MTPDACADIHAAAFTQSRPWRVEEFKLLFAHPATRLIGHDAAFVIARLIADEAEILTIATHPDQQRKGHAKAVLNQLFYRLSAEGCTSVFLEVAADNDSARALYENEGFAPLGTRKGYYARANAASVDALTLRKYLTKR